MKKTASVIVTILIVGLIILALIYHFQLNSSKRPRENPIVVQVSKVELRPAPLFYKTPGTVEAAQSVSVQPQSSGMIKNIYFSAGQEVTKGQLLFQIDSATYRAELTKAQANSAKDQVQLAEIKTDLARYQPLLKKGYVSKQQYSQTESQLKAQASTVKLDQAAIKQAQIALGYTNIVAPISGKTGNVVVKEGDIISATANQPLVTINQLTPIFVSFNLPQSYLTTLMEYRDKQPLVVEIYSDASKKMLDKGVLSFIDNKVDSSTGTILLKATIPNRDKLLYPGESVIAKLIYTIENNVLAIPSQAVQNSQNGQFVYLIKNSKAIITKVVVLRQIGKWTFIKSGVALGDMVATSFPPNLQDSAAVSITTAKSVGS